MNSLIDLFGANRILMKDIALLQEGSPNLLIWAAPAMFLFVLIELAVSYFTNKSYYNKKETIGSVLVGIGNVFIGFLLKTFLFLVFVWIYIDWKPQAHKKLPC